MDASLLRSDVRQLRIQVSWLSASVARIGKYLGAEGEVNGQNRDRLLPTDRGREVRTRFVRSCRSTSRHFVPLVWSPIGRPLQCSPATARSSIIMKNQPMGTSGLSEERCGAVAQLLRAGAARHEGLPVRADRSDAGAHASVALAGARNRCNRRTSRLNRCRQARTRGGGM